MTWVIEVELYTAGGGVTRYTATLKRNRAPFADEVINVSGMKILFPTVLQLGIDKWRAISRMNIATIEDLRKVKAALKDGGFEAVRSWKR